MVIDYKGVKFSFDDRKKVRRIRLFRLSMLALILFLASMTLFVVWDSGKLSGVQKMLLTGEHQQAAKRFNEIESSFFHTDTRQEIQALVELYNGSIDIAKERFTRLGDASTSVKTSEFLTDFLQSARYRELAVYNSYLLKKAGTNPDGTLLYYDAVAKSALMENLQSEAAIKQMSPDTKKQYEKELVLIRKTNAQVKTGQVNFIHDTNGKPLASFHVADKHTQSLTPGIDFQKFSSDLNHSLKLYSLTIDHDLQVLLHRLFRNFNGSFLLFNVSDSSIAAAYSKPMNPEHADNNEQMTNAVFHQQYEPGSIVKLITLTSYLNKFPTGNKEGLFPFTCKGNWKIEGQLFYDWITHKKVETADDALAVSCNLAFAHMGTELGYKSMENYFRKFFFNGPGMKDLFLDFSTGRINESVANGYQLANLAVGLEEVTMTSFHAALLSLAISQNGAIYRPHMIRNKKNILNIAYYNHAPELLTLLKDNAAFQKVKNAMLYVVESPDGTGRRSRVQDVQVALKTGTAGSKKQGLDAIITGYFPAKKPQYAFALRLERAGKAEWKGAAFLKNFLTSFYNIRK